MSSPRPTRWFGLLMTSALLLIWGAGLTDAILGGLQPGKMPRGVFRPYPVEGVLITCVIITVEFGVLLLILRPFSLSGRCRLWVALGIFAPLWVADFILFSGWTDQPGYGYSNGFFLLLVNVFLVVSLLISSQLLHRPPETKAHEAV